MTFEEIDERYHDAAIDDVGEAWHEEAPPEAPAVPADEPVGASPGEPEGPRPAGGRG